MKNWEALKALMEGKCVRHPSWTSTLFIRTDGTFSSGHIVDSDPEWHLLRVKDGWEIYDPGHDWSWACAELLAGRAVRRKTWTSGAVFYITDIDFWKYLKCASPNMPTDNAIVSRCDLSATDWVSAEAPK